MSKQDSVFQLSSLSSSTLSDYISLLKPRVMSLVVFTGLIGLYMAPGYIHPLMSLITILCIAIGSGAAASINMWYDKDIDSVMSRTQNRCIPMGRVHEVEALHLGVILGFLCVALMGLFVNIISAALLGFAIIFYSAIYTMCLKRRTVQNIVIGGVSGAMPPIIGWAAVTNSVGIESIILFLVIFLWTPPHFWALALKNDQDYKLANIPMLPSVRGRYATLKAILFYTLLLVLVSVLPYFLNMVNILYLLVSLLLGAEFLYLSIKMFYDPNYYMKTFKYSIFYLFLLFLLLAVTKI